MKTATFIQKDDSSPNSRGVCSGGKPGAATSFGIHTDVSNLMCDAEANCYPGTTVHTKSGNLINVRQHIKEHRRMRRSLNLAKEVQQNLLPKLRPDYKGLDIAGKSIYCDETGGDYFDYHDLGDGDREKLGVAIGDVSGHGISAALLMATVRAALRQRISLKGSLKDIISDVNRQLVTDVEESSRFISLFYLAIDHPERTLRWVRAGHTPALVYDPDTDTFEELNGPGVVLGVDAGLRYEENKKHNMKKGQVIVLATDGILETRNPEGRMFGRASIVNVVRQNRSAGAEKILDAVFDALHRFRREAELEDDITLVVIKIEN